MAIIETTRLRHRRQRNFRTRATVADRLQRSIDEACTIARRHVKERDTTAYEAAQCFIRALRALQKPETD
jgi:hypothetical protein